MSKLKETKQAMEEIDQRKGVGPRGKRALETMKKCYEQAKQMSDYPHTLGALEQSLNDISKKFIRVNRNYSQKSFR